MNSQTGAVYKKNSSVLLGNQTWLCWPDAYLNSDKLGKSWWPHCPPSSTWMSNLIKKKKKKRKKVKINSLPVCTELQHRNVIRFFFQSYPGKKQSKASEPPLQGAADHFTPESSFQGSRCHVGPTGGLTENIWKVLDQWAWGLVGHIHPSTFYNATVTVVIEAQTTYPSSRFQMEWDRLLQP